MKPMLSAFLAIAVIAFGADYALHRAGFSAAERTSSPDVRLN